MHREKHIEKQQEIYKYIQRYVLQQGFSPTEMEIAEYVGRTRKTIRKTLTTLAENGRISFKDGCKRSVRLHINVRSDLDLPITGKIAAGKPIEPLETHQVLVLSDLLIGSDRFVLQVVGNSMSGDNICDGDYIICERRDNAKDGEIVVALINESEATLKRLQRNDNDTIALLPSNPDLSPLVYPADQVKIQGVYLGLIRLTAHS